MGMPSPHDGDIRVMNEITPLNTIESKVIQGTDLSAFITENLTFKDSNLRHDYSLLISLGFVRSIIPKSS